MTPKPPRRPRSPRANGKLNQARLAEAAAAIVKPDQLAGIPPAAAKALAVAWQHQLVAATGCTIRTARAHIKATIERVTPPNA